jgi:lipoprotein-releasing system ATP-binding protein
VNAAVVGTTPRLRARGLMKAYPGLTVLSGADIDVAAGEVVAVRGASGTGKSTLLHLLGLLERPDAGSVEIDGEDTVGLSRESRARVRATKLGFVFQAFHLLPEFSVIENIVMAARTARMPLEESTDRAHDLLGRLGLATRADAQTTVLSGGERQRVALCRALLARPGTLLADEPTGNLDPATAAVVFGELVKLAKADGAAVVVVTHDPAVAAQADRTLELSGGRLH